MAAEAQMNRPAMPPRSSTAAQDEAAQARELQAFLQEQDPVDIAAADWHTRREQGLDAAGQAQFDQWLAASPRHAAALHALDQGLAAARAIPAELIARLRAGAARPQPQSPQRARAHTPPQAQPRQAAWSRLLPRPALVALCCTLVLAVGAGWHQWQQQPTFTSTHLAERGQRKNLTLPDGSELALDADTQAQVALYRDRREVRITRGQILFAVAPDSAKPFHVLAGPARITVVGTRFSVRLHGSGRDAGAVDVAVQEGHVRVAPAAAAPSGEPVDLVAGQGLGVAADGVAGPVRPVAPSSIALWRKGLVRFENTPLADALAELERYGPTGLVIRDPAVAALPIGGSYPLGRPADFARMLAQILPVRLVPAPGGATEITAAP